MRDSYKELDTMHILAAFALLNFLLCLLTGHQAVFISLPALWAGSSQRTHVVGLLSFRDHCSVPSVQCFIYFAWYFIVLCRMVTLVPVTHLS